MSIRLSGIFVYPVKAVRGVAQDHAVVEPAGLAADRRWVVVAADGRFISQRTHPALARVAAQAIAGGLVLTAPGQPALTVAEPVGEQRQSVQIWRDTVSAAAAGQAADQWFSRYLAEPCRLAWMDQACRRPLTGATAAPGSTVSFADGYPLLIASEASLDDLNRRLADPVPMDRFRPNLVVSGCHAFAEDGWTSLAIGEARFTAAGACARCQVTTIDQATGRSAGSEPLRTLAGYRPTADGAIFGVNLMVARPGVVHVGDEVRLTE